MSVHEPERLARAALNRLGEPGELRMSSLADELGAVNLYALLRRERDPQGLLTDVATRLVTVDPARELDQAHRLGLRFLIPSDTEWPRQLGDLAACAPLHERGGVPLGLWVKGPLRLDTLEVSVAIVGARASTTYGNSVAGEIASVVSRAGVPVVSGAAFGIDVAAHRGAVNADGATVAVLACGADRAYPQAHRPLIDHLATTGAVVSEAPPGCAPQRIRFLARNRIIAGLTRGTVVVEAARRSGSLNTANWAQRMNRVVLGVPGPVTSASSGGVHREIRSGAMMLVTSGADVLEMVGGSGEHLAEEPRDAASPRDLLPLRQQQVLDAVPVWSPANADSISRVAGLGILEVRSALTRLQGAGLVERTESGWQLAALAHT